MSDVFVSENEWKKERRQEEADRAAAERREQNVRELVRQAACLLAIMKSHLMAPTDTSRIALNDSADRTSAAIAAVREEYTTDKGESR